MKWISLVFKLISRHTSLDRALKQLNPNWSRMNWLPVYASSKPQILHIARRLPCCLVELSFHMDTLSWIEDMGTRAKEAGPTRIVLFHSKSLPVLPSLGNSIFFWDVRLVFFPIMEKDDIELSSFQANCVTHGGIFGECHRWTPL